jgi:hypothetical protein
MDEHQSHVWMIGVVAVVAIAAVILIFLSLNGPKTYESTKIGQASQLSMLLSSEEQTNPVVSGKFLFACLKTGLQGKCCSGSDIGSDIGGGKTCGSCDYERDNCFGEFWTRPDKT